MGFIYLIRLNGTTRVYIGQTIGTVEHRWYEHKQNARRLQEHRAAGKTLPALEGSHIYNAMIHYGVENFSIETIIEANDSELNDLEVAMIEEYEARTTGFNLASGGDSFRHSKTTIKLMSQRKQANVDKHRHEKIQGFPPHTCYRPAGECGRTRDSVNVVMHPLCKRKAFYLDNYGGSFEAVRAAIVAFLHDLEMAGLPYVRLYNERTGLPIGTEKVKNGYVVKKRLDGCTCPRSFTNRAVSDAEKREAAVAYARSLDPCEKHVHRLDVSGLVLAAQSPPVVSQPLVVEAQACPEDWIKI